MNDVFREYIVNHTDNGKCIGCGQCCSDVLPLSRYEVDRIKRYIKKYGIREQRKNVAANADFTCPFRDEKERKCTIYPVRPDICRVFKCDDDIFNIERRKALYHKTRQIVFMKKEFFGNDEVQEYIRKMMYETLRMNQQSHGGI